MTAKLTALPPLDVLNAKWDAVEDINNLYNDGELKKPEVREHKMFISLVPHL